MLLFKRENLEGLDESLHGLYEQKDGAFFLKVQGAVGEDSVSGLKANHDALLAEKKEQQRLAQEAEAERLRIEQEAQLELARKNGDWKSIEDDLRNQLLERDNRIVEIQNKHEQDIISRKATEIASKLAKSAFMPYMVSDVEKRIKRDVDGTWRFKDKNGNMTAMNETEFSNDLCNDGRYADFIVINNSSGGGATGGNFGGGAAKKPSEMTEQERTELYRTDPAAYRQLFNIK